MAEWIWYPGDFELYHAMKQNFSRVERGYGWPAFWKSEGFRNRVVFMRTYVLEEKTSFQVFSKAVGFCMVKAEGREKKYPFGRQITCGPGLVEIFVHAGCIETFPSIYIQGEVICSDSGWMVEDYVSQGLPAGTCRYFTRPDQDPSRWNYSQERYLPIAVTDTPEGVLFEFETELTAVLKVTWKQGYRPITICCGESRQEALDPVHCYYSWRPEEETGKTPCCALRFAFVPGCSSQEIDLYALHQYVDIPVRASFQSDDTLLNRIWSVAAHTFQLCSGIFFIDGVKRDKWIWSGDAYQSFFVNQYLMADPDINRRTLLALRGNDPMVTHINTILDYSLYWILGIKAHYDAYGDVDFLEQVYPKMCSLMKFCEEQMDAQGFLVGREGDWIFLDWADFDREGPLCGEQMLYCACWNAMAETAELLGREGEAFRNRYEELKGKIPEYYWDEEQGAFVDSFSSGKKHVTRHANIFAILFDLAGEEQKRTILERVLKNPKVPAITTPYFKFYEMDAMCRMGCYREVLAQIRDYWGGMLKRGTVTFWEEYDPSVPDEEQYDMYGDHFGKSLCHAWAASPIYLLAKHFVGLQITDPVSGEYRLEPHLEEFGQMDCILPVKDRQLHIHWDGKQLTAASNGQHGTRTREV